MLSGLLAPSDDFGVADKVGIAKLDRASRATCSSRVRTAERLQSGSTEQDKLSDDKKNDGEFFETQRF